MEALKCVLVLFVFKAACGYNLGPQDVVFHFFSRDNPDESTPLLPNEGSIMTSTFSNERRTVFTIHSNNETVGGNFNAFVVPPHLAVEDVNILAVDWSAVASQYTVGLANAPQVGERIATFIDLLTNTFNHNPAFIRIVGVGLGGHIAGIAARQASADINHIIALDPSLIGWTHHPDRLKASDAGVVEVLHTTAGILGYDNPLGDVDFYPNGGVQQTGCFVDVSCSHIYSYVYYAESIERENKEDANAFVGTKCEDYESALSLNCDGDRDATFGGTNVKTEVSGIYTFSTNASPPFAQG